MRSSTGRAITLAVPVVFILVLASCADRGSERGGANAAAPLRVSCETLDRLDSYRYSVSVKITNPESTPMASPAPWATGEALGAEAVAVALTDFTLSGAYVAPDRTQAVMQTGGDELEVRTIGNLSWTRVGDQWRDQVPGESPLLTPRIICDELIVTIAPSISDAQPARESLDGIAVTHYKTARASITHVSPLIGTVEGEYTVDLWIAEGGAWPAKLVIQSSSSGDTGASFQMTMELADVEDPGITVEEPEF